MRLSLSNTFRQAILVACLFFLTVPDGVAQSRRYRPPPQYLEFGEPDQAEGRRILEEFRQQGIAGEFYLEFVLRVMPKEGAERLVPGRLWGGRNDRGPISRVALAATEAGGAERRLLIQGGPKPMAWQFRGGAGDAEAITSGALFTALADTDLTAFDLQMPFLYWDDFVFEGLARMRGRPAHTFLLYPPAEIAERRPDLAGVRVYLDAQWGALVQAEHIGEDNAVLKTMSVVEVKKIEDQWMVKTIDLRDEATRNKTRFQVTGVALSQRFAPGTFEPGTLNESPRPPSRAQIVRLAP